jgi:flagellar biosynthesis/type III secretory pathway protein FliH
MGRVIKAREAIARPDRLGHRGQTGLAALLQSRREARGPSAEARNRLLDLACRIAELIVGERVERAPEILGRIYDKALAGLAPLPPLSIRVHPEDRALGGIAGLARERGCRVIDDPAVGRGGVVVAWERAELDASLAALRAALRDAAEGTEA